AELAGVTLAAGPARTCRVVATAGQSVVHSQPEPGGDDLVLGEPDQWGVDGEVVDGGAQTGGLLESGNELGPTVGVSRIVDCGHADEDVACADGLGVGQREREEDGVAGRDVAAGNTRFDLFDAAALGNRDVAGQRRAAELSQVDVDHAMTCG